MSGTRSRRLVAICMWCGKIRTGSGEWRRRRPAVGGKTDYTHGICPECAKKMSDELQAYGAS